MKKPTITTSLSALSVLLVACTQPGHDVGDIRIEMSKIENEPHVSVVISRLGPPPRKLVDEAYALAREECLKVMEPTPSEDLLEPELQSALDFAEFVLNELRSTGKWKGPCSFIVS